jgi:hypothetical protein
MAQQNEFTKEQQEKIDFLIKNIDIYPDFPKPGINFRYVTDPMFEVT